MMLTNIRVPLRRNVLKKLRKTLQCSIQINMLNNVLGENLRLSLIQELGTYTVSCKSDAQDLDLN